MADPFTIVQVISASASLAMQCARVAKALHDLAGTYKSAEISILSTAHELDIVRLAWERIENVLTSWGNPDAADHGLVTELRLKLDFGRAVVSSLADDIDAYTKRPEYVWDKVNFKDHQDRIRGQVAAMTLLVSVLSLPTALARSDMLSKGASILLDSDESALSIVPSRSSSRFPPMFSENCPSNLESSALAYYQPSFDNEIFAERVSKRNFRHALMFFKTGVPEQIEPCQITNPELAKASQFAELDETESSQMIEPGNSRTTDNTTQWEIFKSFGVSIADPCHKVLPAALKQYNIDADWRQYALYVAYGDQERCLGLEEQPLVLFMQLDREGRKPIFMLRNHAT